MRSYDKTMKIMHLIRRANLERNILIKFRKLQNLSTFYRTCLRKHAPLPGIWAKKADANANRSYLLEANKAPS